jgi:hypothetical protein
MSGKACHVFSRQPSRRKFVCFHWDILYICTWFSLSPIMVLKFPWWCSQCVTTHSVVGVYQCFVLETTKLLEQENYTVFSSGVTVIRRWYCWDVMFVSVCVDLC